ncbi:MAG: D-glycero-beta-D-manno-heptose 1,7-bisphosphate 7-phosphatase [Pseudomonadota bacterium]
MTALVILDRDGVINEDSDAFVKTVAEWRPIAGSIEAIAKLSSAGMTIAVATNQSGIGRGLFTRQTVYRMHAKMRRLVRAAGGEIAHVVFCPHRPDEDSECRKPKPGMLYQIGRLTGIALPGAWMVGDSLRDLQAGQTVGCQLILVRTGKGKATERQAASDRPHWWSNVTVVDDLAAAAEVMLRAAA